MDEHFSINLDNPSDYDAMSSLVCVTSSCRIVIKEVNKETYPGPEEFENKQQMISYADTARDFLEWINRHVEKTRI